jgi:hypothetical protein
MHIWRSGGWPCRDAIEIDLIAAAWVSVSMADSGHETLKLTDAGIQLLAASRQRNQRAASLHDRLAARVAQQLMEAGRIVWRELSLRAQVSTADEPPTSTWRIARPDVFSVRNTSVEAYLQPVVHEVKASRADLLSDLRHAAKRASYQWLCSECFYVFPAGVAEPDEIPEAFGVMVVHGDIDSGALELLRPARHAACTLPFAVWLALAKATPLRNEADAAQLHLGNPGEPPC